MDHLAGYLDITFDQFLYLLASITEGLRMTDVRLSSLQCTNLDHLCTFFFKQLNSPKVTVLHPVTQYVKERPDLLQYNMHIFIQMLCLDDSHLYWSLARPLLSLILLDEKVRPRAFFVWMDVWTLTFESSFSPITARSSLICSRASAAKIFTMCVAPPQIVLAEAARVVFTHLPLFFR